MSCSPESPLIVTRRRLLVLAGLACGSALADEFELRKISRASEVPRDAALETLLGRLRSLVNERNHRSLEALMASNFRVEFDVGQGPRVFHRHWVTESPESPVWKILERLLSLDGTFYSPTLYVLPYIYARFPSDLDPLAHVVAVNDDVALFDKPETGVKPLGFLQHSIVPLATPMKPPVILPSDGFIEVRHPVFGRCFVAASGVYSPAGHRAFFEKRRGEWRWISLVAATLAGPPRFEPLKAGA